MNMDVTGFEQVVRERAYYMWENEGRPMGRDVEHWLVSEEELRAETACAAEAEAPEAALGEVSAPEAVIAAPKPARAKKAAASKAKAASPKKKPAVAARRGATAPEMSITLQ